VNRNNGSTQACILNSLRPYTTRALRRLHFLGTEALTDRPVRLRCSRIVRQNLNFIHLLIFHTRGKVIYQTGSVVRWDYATYSNLQFNKSTTEGSYRIVLWECFLDTNNEKATNQKALKSPILWLMAQFCNWFYQIHLNCDRREELRSVRFPAIILQYSCFTEYELRTNAFQRSYESFPVFYES
jgi:hypothetical protein